MLKSRCNSYIAKKRKIKTKTPSDVTLVVTLLDNDIVVGGAGGRRREYNRTTTSRRSARTGGGARRLRRHMQQGIRRRWRRSRRRRRAHRARIAESLRAAVLRRVEEAQIKLRTGVEGHVRRQLVWGRRRTTAERARHRGLYFEHVHRTYLCVVLSIALSIFNNTTIQTYSSTTTNCARFLV